MQYTEQFNYSKKCNQHGCLYTNEFTLVCWPPRHQEQLALDSSDIHSLPLHYGTRMRLLVTFLDRPQRQMCCCCECNLKPAKTKKRFGKWVTGEKPCLQCSVVNTKGTEIYGPVYELCSSKPVSTWDYQDTTARFLNRLSLALSGSISQVLKRLEWFRLLHTELRLQSELLVKVGAALVFGPVSMVWTQALHMTSRH